MSDTLFLWEHVYELSTEGMVQVVAFSKRVPGFLLLPQPDQIVLLKAACLEILVWLKFRLNFAIMYTANV